MTIPIHAFNYADFLKNSDDSKYACHKAIMRDDLRTLSDPFEADDKFGFTPLHVAVLCQNLEAVSLLISTHPELISKEDFRKWTPLHFSSIFNLDIHEALMKTTIGKQTATSAKNSLGATPQDLQKFLKRCPSQGDEIVFQYKIDDKIKEGTAVEFEAFFGASFTPHLLADSKSLLSLWPYEMPLRSEQTLNDPLDSLLYVAKVNAAIGWGVFASKDIKKGQVLAKYTGDILTQKEFSSIPYTPEKIKYAVPLETYVIDGAKSRNLAAMMNCGFPNALPYFTYMGDGLPTYFLIALEDIKEHEQICFDYGAYYPCKQKGYQELRQEALDQFLRDLNSNTEMDSLNKQEKLKYIEQTPSVMYAALLNQKINGELFQQKKPIIAAIEHIIKLNDPRISNMFIQLLESKSLISVEALLKSVFKAFPQSLLEHGDSFCDAYQEAAEMIFDYLNGMADAPKHLLSSKMPEIMRPFAIQEITDLLKLIKNEQNNEKIETLLSICNHYK